MGQGEVEVVEGVSVEESFWGVLRVGIQNASQKEAPVLLFRG